MVYDMENKEPQFAGCNGTGLKLPNLKELIKYHPYHISTFANFADVTVDLLKAVINGEEELTSMELVNISRYVGIPKSVLTCPSLIMLSRERHRHRRMMEDLEEKLYFIYHATKQESTEAKNYMRWERPSFVNMLLDFQNQKQVSYCRYLGEKEKLEQAILFIKCEMHKPRERKVRVVA